MKTKIPPFHDIFTDERLKRVNRDFRRGRDEADTKTIIETAMAHATELGFDVSNPDCPDLDKYLGREREKYPGSGRDILDWYANGAKAPRDRPGMIAVLHPQVHKRVDWMAFTQTFVEMATALRRWIWVVECQGSRWYMFMLGDDPAVVDGADESPAWKAHVRSGDQYIAVISPIGEWRVLGLS